MTVKVKKFDLETNYFNSEEGKKYFKKIKKLAKVIFLNLVFFN